MSEVANVEHPPRRAHLWVLAGITVFAGILRFTMLDRPAIWYDEAATFARISGSFQELLDVLQHDGFTPLHYELYWILSRVFKMTPFVMRFVPALAGTLMVPAMYFLARQLVATRTALLAAAFTACSGFLLAYSRDAKMYSHFWLMCTLNVGCLMWWLRTQKLVAWFGWVAAGVAMIGLHMPGLVILGLQPLFLLTRSRRGFVCDPHHPALSRTLHETLVILLFLAGTMLITAGGAVHYLKFSRWTDPSTREGQTAWPDLWWIADYNRGRDGAAMLTHVGSYFLAGYPWPSMIERENVPERILRRETVAVALILIPLALGIFAWPKKWRGIDGNDDAVEPPWRVTFWLLFWIIVPTYGFYCASVDDYVSPLAWVQTLLDTAKERAVFAFLVFLIAAIILLFAWRAKRIQEQLLRLVEVAMIVAGICLACGGIYFAFKSHEANSLWVPRYLGMLWPALGIGAAALIMRLPTRPVRWLAIALLLSINVAQEAAIVVMQTEPPIDQIARDVWQTQTGPTRTFIDTELHAQAGPGGGSINSIVGNYYLALESGHPLPPSMMHSRWRSSDDRYQWNLWQIDDGYALRTVLNSSPDLNRIILWDKVSGEDDLSHSPLTTELPAHWKLISEMHRPVWNIGWQYLYTARRREYVKVAVARATRP